MPTRSLVTRYEDDLARFPDLWHKVGVALGAAFLLMLPVVAGPYWLNVATLAMVAVVGSVGLMVLTGFTGQVSLGHAAFLALGAYTAAVGARSFGAPFWLLLPAAGAVAAAVGLMVGPFALRLKGLYLAIVTLGLGFLVNHVLLSFPELTRGVSGITAPMYLSFGEGAGRPAVTWFTSKTALGGGQIEFHHKLYLLYLAITTGVVLAAGNLARSDAGRAMMAVRDHDLAAAVLGVDPAKTKIAAFGVSSFLTGMAGAMFAWHQQLITVDPPFNLVMSVQYVAMIVLGGIGTVFGAVAGAVMFTVLTPVAEAVGRSLPLVNQLSSAQQSTLLFSLVVCGFLLFEPLGLFGIWLRIKRYFLAWPFRY